MTAIHQPVAVVMAAAGWRGQRVGSPEHRTLVGGQRGGRGCSKKT